MPRFHENMKRFCQRCRQSRIVYWNKAGTSRYCAPCLKKVEKNEPTAAQQASLKRRKRNRQEKVAAALAWLDGYKAQLGCFYCPESDPICLDCHHEDPSAKVMDLAKLIRLKPDLDVIKKELQKCKVICANCYRKHHQKLRKGDAEEVPLAIEASDLPKPRKERELQKRPAGFSEAMEELRRKCFPDPAQPAAALSTDELVAAKTVDEASNDASDEVFVNEEDPATGV